jgi:hypothetical protein
MRSLRKIQLATSILLLLGAMADAKAQSSSSAQVALNPLGQYQSIKALVAQHLHNVDYGSRSEGEQYNLASCGDMELVLGLGPDGNDGKTDALMRIAGYQHTWVTELPEFGYPKEVVIPLVRAAEKSLLEYAVSHGDDGEGFYNKIHSEANVIATKLGEFKSKHNQNAANVEFMDECGGGGNLIKFKIPKDAHMFIIPSLYIQYCKNQGIDPADRTACDRYRELFDGKEEMLSGVYDYVAEWSDGYTRKGKFDSLGMPAKFTLKR